jgi:hypothetical protein
LDIDKSILLSGQSKLKIQCLRPIGTQKLCWPVEHIGHVGLALNRPRGFLVCRIPDEEAGELPMGFIKVADGQKITDEEVKEYVAKQVSP